MSNTNYNGVRGMVNCTVNHPDMDRAKAEQKELSAVAIREYAKHSKKKNAKGERTLTHTITEEVHKDGLDEKVKVKVSTKRRNN